MQSCSMCLFSVYILIVLMSIIPFSITAISFYRKNIWIQIEFKKKLKRKTSWWEEMKKLFMIAISDAVRLCHAYRIFVEGWAILQGFEIFYFICHRWGGTHSFFFCYPSYMEVEKYKFVFLRLEEIEFLKNIKEVLFLKYGMFSWICDKSLNNWFYSFFYILLKNKTRNIKCKLFNIFH